MTRPTPTVGLPMACAMVLATAVVLMPHAAQAVSPNLGTTRAGSTALGDTAATSEGSSALGPNGNSAYGRPAGGTANVAPDRPSGPTNSPAVGGSGATGGIDSGPIGTVRPADGGRGPLQGAGE